MQLHPLEVEVYYVLPALRSEFARALKARGMTQKRIAELLGVTEAAVSQYMHAKRGTEAMPELKKVVTEAAGRIETSKDALRELQKVIELARDKRVICRLHEAHTDVPKGCDVCFGGKS